MTWLTVLAVMFGASLVLYAVTRGYVFVLVLIGKNQGKLIKMVAGIGLGMIYVSAVVAPLLITLSIDTVRDAVQGSWLFFGWLGLCFVGCVIPSIRYIYITRINDLRSAGFYGIEQ